MLLFEDGFGQMRAGSIGSEVGAHAEYHYLPEVGAKGNWHISTFSSGAASQRAWRIVRHNGQAALLQTYENKLAHSHPMVVGGDSLWRDYTVTARFAPASDKGRCGLVFRYRNDRCNYFFGVDGAKAVLKMIRHESDFRKPLEQVLASQDCSWKPGDELLAEVTVAGPRIEATLNGNVRLMASDSTYSEGKIGLVSDVPARFASIRVTGAPAEQARVAAARARVEAEERALQAANPKAVLWKKFKTEGFGVGRNLRFGDLDGDGQIDILIGQVLHHGPKDRQQRGELPDRGHAGRREALADRRAGRLEGPSDQRRRLSDPRPRRRRSQRSGLLQGPGTHRRRRRDRARPNARSPTPEMPANRPRRATVSRASWATRIFFCDLRGMGRAADLVLKDRYDSFWAFNDQLEPLWQAQCNTGHYPYAYDVDGDGNDELAIGYSLFDHDGKQAVDAGRQLKDHADGVAMVRFARRRRRSRG